MRIIRLDDAHYIDLSRCRLVIPDDAIRSQEKSDIEPCQTIEKEVECNQNFENNTEQMNDWQSIQGGIDLSRYKIRRVITINGKKHEVYAETEQEYAEKIIQAFCACNADKGEATDVKTCRTEPDAKPTGHLFRDYAKSWFDTYAAPNVSTASRRSYETQLKANILPVIGDKYIEEITVSDVQMIFNKMGSACTKSSKNKCRIPLRQIFNCAVEDGIISKNPAISTRLKIISTRSVETQAYTVDEMRFLAANLDKVNSPMDRIWLALSMFHPLRPEEVLGLKYKDIDRENLKINVCRAVTHPMRNAPEIKDTKTEGSHRILSLVPKTLDYLPNGDPEDFIIGGKLPLSYTSVRHLRMRIKKETGFESDITPRRFRCTVLTDIYDTTKDVKQVQQAAGHTTAAMTLKHYVKGRTQTDDSAKVIAELYSVNAG